MKRTPPTKSTALKSSFPPLPVLYKHTMIPSESSIRPPPARHIDHAFATNDHTVQVWCSPCGPKPSNFKQPSVNHPSLSPRGNQNSNHKQKRAGQETRGLTVTVNPVMLIRTAHIRLADAHRAGPSGGGSGSGKRYTTNGIAAHPGSTMPGSAVSTSTTTAVGVNISSDPLGDADC